ncbi:hypothetical protein T265_02236 [Opisthorchis viverrini]|uniref:Uncharacterized protein n=1 Tax=Opisthorchis viverrini TaxID=6198 RepID=A0A075A7G2_OPIVI|nr:hypothetical protein T265_02236 [Opisthorchis viverrini]KER31600.1 hypothetical protein T265_02236 [Opisthorchis viverrini]
MSYVQSLNGSATDGCFLQTNTISNPKLSEMINWDAETSNSDNNLMTNVLLLLVYGLSCYVLRLVRQLRSILLYGSET